MAIQILSGITNTIWTIDSTSTAGRVTLYDQNGNPMSDVSSLSNVLNALNAAVTVVLGGQSTLGIDVESTSGSLTLSFEATINNVVWFAINATPLAGGSVVTSTSANGQWVADTSGFYAVRARVSTFTSGSMTVSVVITPNGSKNISQAITTSGSLTVAQATAANLNALVAQGVPNTAANSWPVEITDGTNVLGTSGHPVKIDPTGTTTQPVSGTVTANAGSGTFTVSGTITSNIGTTNGLALDSSINGILVSQGSTTSGEKGTLIQGAVTTAAPSYTTAQTSPLSLTTAGALRIDGSAVTQPVSGTVTANAGTGNFTNASIGPTAAAPPADATYAGALVNTSAPSGYTNGDMYALSLTTGGLLRMDGVYPTGAAAGADANLIAGAVTTAAPTYTTGQMNNISLNTSGGLRVDGSGVTQPVSGTVTANQGTANSTANSWPTTITDGTHGPAAVKAASTAAVATDPSVVVALSSNSPLPNVGSADANNSSTATLGSAGVFTGTSSSSFGYSSIGVTVMAIGASAPPGTLSVQQSTDGSNWDIQDNYTVTGGTASPNGEFDVGLNLRASFYRIVYTNGATAQTAFRLQTVRVPIQAPHADAPTQKGIQAVTFLPVQEPKDTGRTVRIFEATAIAGVITEAMLTLTPSSNFVAGSTGTSFTVTAGKTFRIQMITFAITPSSTTATAGQVKLRISSSGTVTTSTNPVAFVCPSATSAVSGATIGASVTFPDGLELSGTMQFGLSQVVSSTSSTVSASIIGYEY